jgi:hypothetical protein
MSEMTQQRETKDQRVRQLSHNPAVTGRAATGTIRKSGAIDGQSFPSIGLASPGDIGCSVLHLTHALGIQRTGRMILFKIIANAALLPW